MDASSSLTGGSDKYFPRPHVNILSPPPLAVADPAGGIFFSFFGSVPLDDVGQNFSWHFQIDDAGIL